MSLWQDNKCAFVITFTAGMAFRHYLLSFVFPEHLCSAASSLYSSLVTRK